MKHILSAFLVLMLVLSYAALADPAEKQGACAVMRGGTVVLQIPGSVCDKVYDFEPPWISGPAGIKSEKDANSMLRSVLTEQQYEMFIAEYVNRGIAEITIQIPDVINGLMLSRRRFADDWYICLRPSEDVEEDSISLDWCIQQTTYKLDENGLEISVTGEYFNHEYTSVALKRVNALEPAFTCENGKLKAEVFCCDGINIAVLRDREHKAEQLNNSCFSNGSFGGVPILNFYENKDVAVSCCVLTDAEVVQLKKGTKIKIKRLEL